MANVRIEAHKLAYRAAPEALYVAFLDKPDYPELSAVKLEAAAGCDVAAVIVDLKEAGHAKQVRPSAIAIAADGRAFFNATERE